MSTTAKVQLALFLIIAAVVSVTVGYIGRLQRTNQALALRAYNDSAALDTSRSLLLSRSDSIRLLGDTLRGATKLVGQLRQQNDALDRAMGVERTLRLAITATVDSLRAIAVPSTAPMVTDSQDTRHAAFHVEHGPYTAQIGVSVPRTGAATLDSLVVKPQSARLALHVGCEPANGDGVRPARVTVTSPTWMAISVDGAEQDPDVCQGVAGQRTSWMRRLFTTFATELYVGAGLSVDPFPVFRGEPPKVAPAVHVGVSLWHVPLRIPWP